MDLKLEKLKKILMHRNGHRLHGPPSGLYNRKTYSNDRFFSQQTLEGPKIPKALFQPTLKSNGANKFAGDSISWIDRVVTNIEANIKPTQYE